MAGSARLGVKGLTEKMTGDELDAVTAALTGRWLLLGWAEMLGGEGGIVIPAAQRTSKPWLQFANFRLDALIVET